MLDALLTGIGAGLLLPFLPGPVLFAIIRSSIEKGFQAGFSIALGVFLSDVLFIVVMLFGSSYVPIAQEFNEYNKMVGYIGGGIMLSIGLFYIFKKTELNLTESSEKISRSSFLFKGIFMSLFSPPTILYWITVTSIVTLQFKYTLDQKIVFFVCLLGAQISVDTIKAYFSGKLRNKITVKTIRNINRIAGLMLILFATRLLLEAFLGKKLF